MAALVEARLKEDEPDPALLREAMRSVARRRVDARIYGYTKKRVDLGLYLTDAQGVVLYDSSGRAEGRDYSRWNDVYLTLRGRYGARSTRANEADPSSSVLYVAAPVRTGETIVGVLAVYKPVDSIEPFIELARGQILEAGLTAALGLLLLGVIVSVAITRPLIRLTRQVRRLKPGERLRPPRLGGPEIKDLALAFEDLRQELEGMRTVEAYVQALTHEIKSPLASIRAAAELLEEDMPAERRRRFFGNIARETTRITNIVERLLALAALENRSALQGVEKIDVGALFAELQADFEPTAGLAGVRIESDSSAQLQVTGERFLLRQALSNLIQNALDFTPEGGRVVLAARRSGRAGIELSVRDEGPGVPDYARERIFDRFFSLPRPRTNEKSSGLGLSFVKEIADLHGGRIDIGARPDGPGTLACLTLPGQ